MSKSLFFVCPANKMDAAEESFFSNMAVPILTAKDFPGIVITTTPFAGQYEQKQLTPCRKPS